MLVSFFLILSSDLESAKHFAFFGTHIDLFQEKRFQFYIFFALVNKDSSSFVTTALYRIPSCLITEQIINKYKLH